jgi:anthranilate synthase component 1
MINFKTKHIKVISDRVTPVSIYLTIRDKFPMAFLLESSDYHGQENSFSYICFNPIGEFRVNGKEITKKFPGGEEETIQIQQREDVINHLNQYKSSFSYEKQQVKCIHHGLFGYMAYDSVNYFEDIEVSQEDELPAIDYRIFKFIIAIDHFHNELHLFEHSLEGEESEIREIYDIISRKDDPIFPFERKGDEISFTTNEEYLEMVKKGIEHCHRGDVFQIVLSRRFATKFAGDEFNVYRALRSVNPSPYLFYFDYGNFKLFGSSPEAQLVVKDKHASIFPIAGTFKRTGKDAEDAALAEELRNDKKENSEHVMLVDLARNDLSRCADDVKVDVFKEIQYYSHVIHLVSHVTGKLNNHDETIPLAAATFPAGTLSGAPKYKAMQLINKYEKSPRGYYGGAVGYMSFDGDFNHAIMIRSFFSKSNMLHYQAGAGVVVNSKPESELEEVNNKLGALRRALQLAEEINRQ